MHEALYVPLQEGRAHARNGDAVAVAELEHCAAVHIRGDRRRQLLHVLNVGAGRVELALVGDGKRVVGEPSKKMLP
jgi:hypothetical protein